MLKASNGRTQFLSEEDIQNCTRSVCGRVITCSRELLPWAINTAMRKSEILGLAWERIDLDKDLGLIVRIRFHDKKNGEPRGVPLI